MDSLPEKGKAKEYWAWPDSSPKGDASPESIHQAMGYALTIWEANEYFWVGLFCHFVEGRPPNAAARSFGSIISSKGRMEALDAASEVYFHINKVSKEFREKYALIRTHFDCARGKRTDIAHAVTMRFTFADEDAGVFLIPAMYGTKKTFAFIQKDGNRFSSLRSKYRLTSSDIKAMVEKFIRLQQAILHFHDDFARAHPPTE